MDRYRSINPHTIFIKNS